MNLLLTIALLAIFAAGLFGILHFATVQDDAYISFQYAKQLVSGNGLVFNTGERVEGYTNFLWVLLIAPFIAIGIDPADASVWLASLFALATLLLLPIYAGRYRHSVPVFLLVAPLFLVTNRAFLTASTGGLETALFTFLFTLSLLDGLYALGKTGRLTWRHGILATLAVLTRPEGGLIFVAYVIGTFWVGHARKEPWPRRVQWLTPMVVILVPYLLWKLYFFGKLLPNTFYAKVGIQGQWQHGIDYLAAYASHYGLLAVVMITILGSLLLRGWTALAQLGIAAFITVYLAYVAYVGGDFLEFRFVAPILPILFFAMQGAIQAFWDASQRGVVATIILAGTLISVLFANSAPLQSYQHPQELGWTYQALHGDALAKLKVEGPFLKQFVQPGESISLTGIGIIPYLTDLYCYDMLGLISPDVASWPASSPFGNIPGHRKYAYDRYEDRHIDYHVFNPIVPFEQIWTTEPFDDPRVISIFNPANQRYYNFVTSNDVETFRQELAARGAKVHIPTVTHRVVFDFESGELPDWVLKGTAFDRQPVEGSWPGQQHLSGYTGRFLINSFFNGSDTATGRARSPSFLLDAPILMLGVGGGDDIDLIRIELWVDDQLVEVATGNNSEHLYTVEWDLSEYAGRRAYLMLMDNSSESWGHLLLDDVRLMRPRLDQ